MLILVSELSRYWDLRPERILHVGAHAAEEHDQYQQCGWGRGGSLWVEADAESAELARNVLSGDPHAEVIEALAWSESGIHLPFHVASNGESSSALTPASHKDMYPDIAFLEPQTVVSTALADHPTVRKMGPYDFINLDIQGAELKACQGLGEHLEAASAIYSEVNTRELYEGCAQLADLDRFLLEHGFVRVDTEMTSKGWGDALWLRHDAVPALPGLRRILRKSGTLLRRVKNRTSRVVQARRG